MGSSIPLSDKVYIFLKKLDPWLQLCFAIEKSLGGMSLCWLPRYYVICRIYCSLLVKLVLNAILSAVTIIQTVNVVYSRGSSAIRK